MPIDLTTAALFIAIAGARRRAQRILNAAAPAKNRRCPRQASQHLHRADAAATIPIVPNHPRLRSIRLL